MFPRNAEKEQALRDGSPLSRPADPTACVCSTSSRTRKLRLFFVEILGISQPQDFAPSSYLGRAASRRPGARTLDALPPGRPQDAVASSILKETLKHLRKAGYAA